MLHERASPRPWGAIAWSIAGAVVGMAMAIGLGLGLSMAAHGCGGSACAHAGAESANMVVGIVALASALAVISAIAALFRPRAAGWVLLAFSGVVLAGFGAALGMFAGGELAMALPLFMIPPLLLLGAGLQALRLPGRPRPMDAPAHVAGAAVAAAGLSWWEISTLLDTAIRPHVSALPAWLAFLGTLILLLAAVGLTWVPWWSRRRTAMGLIAAGVAYAAAMGGAVVASEWGRLSWMYEQGYLLPGIWPLFPPALLLLAAGFVALADWKRPPVSQFGTG